MPPSHSPARLQGIFLPDKLMPEPAYYSHWGFTALDRRGQLGGVCRHHRPKTSTTVQEHLAAARESYAPPLYPAWPRPRPPHPSFPPRPPAQFPRDWLRCAEPAGRVPTKAAPCAADAATGRLRLQDAIGTDGSPSASNDLSGGYATLELLMMGLLPLEPRLQAHDTEAAYCRDMKYEYDKEADVVRNMSCSEMTFFDAEQVEASLDAQQRARRMEPAGTRSPQLHAAALVVSDAAECGDLPRTREELAWYPDLAWLDEYVTTFLPGEFANATGGRASLSFSAAAAPEARGCALKYYCDWLVEPSPSPSPSV